MRLAVIGGGTMGEAIIAGVLLRELATPQEITVCEPREARCYYLRGEYEVHTTSRPSRAAQEGEISILAVKPQELPGVLAELRGTRQGLVISIVAGATLATLTSGLAQEGVVRAMPNINVRVGEGMTLWTAAPGTSEEQKALARKFLGALGKEVFTAEEKHLDMATALSGSGPAYAFLFMEALMDAGVHLGLPRELAGELVVQTVLGSARLVQEAHRHPAELRNLVTSPGGTTAEALLKLEEGGWTGLLGRAIAAAYARAQALGAAHGGSPPRQGN